MALKLLTRELRAEFSREELLDYGQDVLDIFAAGLLNVVLWEEQVDYIEQSTAPFNVLSAGRRWGKTTAAAVKGLRYGFYRLRPRIDPTAVYDSEKTMKMEMYTILVASRTQAQANLILKEAQRLITHKDSLLKGYYVKIDNSDNFPKLIIKSRNGETFEIHARSLRDDDNLQGWNYDLVIVDEAVRVPRLATDVYTTIMPFTSDTDGIMDFISSPVPTKGDFYIFHQKGTVGSKTYNHEWKSFFGDSRNNPYLGTASKAEMNKRYSSPLLAEIFLGGRFPDGGSEVFSYNDIVEIFKRPKFETGMVEFGDKQPFVYDHFKGHPQNLVHCFDIAKTNDWFVGFSLDISEYFTNNKIYIVGFQRYQGYDYPTIVRDIITQRAALGGGRIVIEKNNTGEAVADYVDKELGQGFVERVHTGNNKEDMIINLQTMIQGHVFEGPEIPCFEEELIAYQMDDKGIVQDCVMSLAVGAYAIEGGGFEYLKSIPMQDATRDFFQTATVVKEKRRLF